MSGSINRYKVFGSVIETNISLPHFPRSKELPSLSFSLAKPRRPIRVRSEDRIFSNYAFKRKQVTYFENDDVYTIRIHASCDFQFIKATRHVYGYPRNGTNESEVCGLFLSHALPIVLNLMGNTLLHGAALFSPGNTCHLVLGEKGRGKSTLTLNSLNHGFKYLSDDAVICRAEENNFYLEPSFPEVRAESLPMQFKEKALGPSIPIFQKNRYPAGSFFINEPQKLDSIFVLMSGEKSSLKVEPLSGQRSLKEILKNLFRARTNDGALLASELEFVHEILERIPVYGIYHYRDLTLIPRVLEAIQNPV